MRNGFLSLRFSPIMKSARRDSLLRKKRTGGNRDSSKRVAARRLERGFLDNQDETASQGQDLLGLALLTEILTWSGSL